jgi:arsenate reductase
VGRKAVKVQKKAGVSMKVYGIKNCDTCRKAARELDAELHDIRENPLSSGRLSQFLKIFGERLLNTRSTTWRGLSDEDREQTPGDLLARHPTLMKRPVIEKDGVLYLGWGSEVKAELL